VCSVVPAALFAIDFFLLHNHNKPVCTLVFCQSISHYKTCMPRRLVEIIDCEGATTKYLLCNIYLRNDFWRFQTVFGFFKTNFSPDRSIWRSSAVCVGIVVISKQSYLAF
jgi:hypothetical protein